MYGGVGVVYNRLNLSPEFPTGTLWNVAVNCTDPIQSQTATIYSQPMPF